MSRPIPAIKCNSYDEVCEKGVGAFCFDKSYTTMFLWLPNDTGPSGIRVGIADQPGQPAWTLTGTENAPTLSPSLNAPGIWHGYLLNGEFVSC